MLIDNTKLQLTYFIKLKNVYFMEINSTAFVGHDGDQSGSFKSLKHF